MIAHPTVDKVNGDFTDLDVVLFTNLKGIVSIQNDKDSIILFSA